MKLTRSQAFIEHMRARYALTMLPADSVKNVLNNILTIFIVFFTRMCWAYFALTFGAFMTAIIGVMSFYESLKSMVSFDPWSLVWFVGSVIFSMIPIAKKMYVSDKYQNSKWHKFTSAMYKKIVAIIAELRWRLRMPIKTIKSWKDVLYNVTTVMICIVRQLVIIAIFNGLIWFFMMTMSELDAYDWFVHGPYMWIVRVIAYSFAAWPVYKAISLTAWYQQSLLHVWYKRHEDSIRTNLEIIWGIFMWVLLGAAIIFLGFTIANGIHSALYDPANCSNMHDGGYYFLRTNGVDDINAFTAQDGGQNTILHEWSYIEFEEASTQNGQLFYLIEFEPTESYYWILASDTSCTP